MKVYIAKARIVDIRKEMVDEREAEKQSEAIKARIFVQAVKLMVEENRKEI